MWFQQDGATSSSYLRYQPPVTQRAVQEPDRQSQIHDSMAAPFSGPELT